MIAITGASGHLGRLVVEDVLDRGAQPQDVVAIARSAEKCVDLAARGVQVRQADYVDREALSAALEGVDRLLLVSSNEVGSRATQHQNVLEVAVEAGIGFIAYTSLLNADSSGILLAGEHVETEQAVRASGIPFSILRNSWYFENYDGVVGSAIEHGSLAGAADDGRFSPATRADYAAAAATVLLGPGHENTVYELGGDQAISLSDLADAIAAASGRPVSYQNLSEGDYRDLLVGLGLPEPYARILADSDRGIARGALFTDSGDLRRLIDRPTTPVSTWLSTLLAK